MLTKTFSADLKAVGFDKDELPSEFEGYAAVFGNVDLGGDKIVKGAFADSLEKRYGSGGAGIPVYWNHNLDDPFGNVGKTLEAKEDDHGLRVRVALDTETSWGKQTARLLKEQRVTQMSFSFDVQEGAFVDSDDGSFYELRKLDLFEVSVVPIGMNQATEIISVKALKEKEREDARQATPPKEETSLPMVEEIDGVPQVFARRETAARKARLLNMEEV